jgi:hypothetical protein
MAHPFFARGLHAEIAEAQGVARVPADKPLAAGDKVQVCMTR